MSPGTRNDGLRLQLGGVDVSTLRAAGTLNGCVVINAGSANGPGSGKLTVSNGHLTWQAPGDPSPGERVPVSGDGQYLLESFTKTRFITVQVYTAYLPRAAQAVVALLDRYSELGPADVASADALAGLITTTHCTLKNLSGNTILNAKLWLDSTASGFAALSVSSDGVNFYQPTSSGDVHVLAWGSIAPGASVDVWVKRTIGAGASSAPGILNALNWAWTGY